MKNEMIHILFLEDEQSAEIERFCRVASENGVDIEIVDSKGKLIEKIRYSSKTYPVVICDIEIWDNADRNHKNRTLTCLGFSCIKELIESYHELSHQYYLLSNCTKRMHSVISRDLKIPVKPKDDVFTDDGLIKFIQEIRMEGNRILNSLKDTGIGHEVFDSLYRFLHHNYMEVFGSIDEIEDMVAQRALVLINYFTNEGHKASNETFFKWEKDGNDNRKKVCVELTYYNMALFFKNKKYSTDTYISDEKYPKFVSHDYEKRKILIKDFLYYTSAKLTQKDVDTINRTDVGLETKKEIVKIFITKLILRRLAIYIHKIYSQKIGLNQKVTHLTDVYPYLTPQDSAFLRHQLFMSDGAKYKTTIKEKQFFVKFYDTTI